VGGSGDLGECVQAPITRRFAPNVCSALAPPGACSQANINFQLFPSVSESKELKGPVSTVIERELKTLFDDKDLKQFNSDFLEENSLSLLHRLSGKV